VDDARHIADQPDESISPQMSTKSPVKTPAKLRRFVSDLAWHLFVPGQSYCEVGAATVPRCSLRTLCPDVFKRAHLVCCTRQQVALSRDLVADEFRRSALETQACRFEVAWGVKSDFRQIDGNTEVSHVQEVYRSFERC
jgi:hypothetical protein